MAAVRFGHPGIEILPLETGNAIEPVEETGETFEANAILKATYYSQHVPGLLFADDSGLEVSALNGDPGVRSARFAGPAATDAVNNELLLERLRGISKREARFVCVIAVARQGQLIKTFQGAVEGRILEAQRGTGGFGYDPLFYYPAFDCSFGEVSSDRKLLVSHRGRALQQMLGWAAGPECPVR